jgi:effector-binding domain-containing protein
VGVPVASPISGNDRIKVSVLPAGSYVTTVYTGLDNGVEATRRLLEWADKEGIIWDTYESDKGDGFISRNEFFLTEPDDEPDTAKWQTEIAIRLADPQS